jgi:hypothetical protein
MRNPLLAAVAAVLLTAATAPPDAAEVVAAERAFARDGAAMGVGPSFLKWSTDEAIVIGGGGVGKAHEEFAGPPPTGPQPALAWWPLFAGIAQSGDFGFTTGPVEIGGKRQGHYFTIWVKRANSWKWIYDGGTGATAEGQPPATTEPTYLPVSKAKPLAPTKALQAAQAAEARLASKARSDVGEAFGSALTEISRVYVAPQPPAVGVKAAVAALKAYPASLVFSPPAGASGSDAGDLIYTYGQVKGTGVNGWYVHLWQRRSDGMKLVFAQIIPARAG